MYWPLHNGYAFICISIVNFGPKSYGLPMVLYNQINESDVIITIFFYSLFFFLNERGNGKFWGAWNLFLTIRLIMVFWWTMVQDFCLKVKHRTWRVQIDCSIFYLHSYDLHDFFQPFLLCRKFYLKLPNHTLPLRPYFSVHALDARRGVTPRVTRWWLQTNGADILHFTDAAACCRPYFL